MSDAQFAGWEHAGRFCRMCHEEITETDRILVDADAEMDDEGQYHDLTRVQHVQCPEEA